jgi:hypothetical protein
MRAWRWLKRVETCRPSECNSKIKRAVFDWYIILISCICKHFGMACSKSKFVKGRLVNSAWQIVCHVVTSGAVSAKSKGSWRWNPLECHALSNVQILFDFSTFRKNVVPSSEDQTVWEEGFSYTLLDCVGSQKTRNVSSPPESAHRDTTLAMH